MNMAVQHHRGANIDDIQDFNHMLVLAVGIGGNSGHILEVNLPMEKRRGTFLNFWAACRAREDTTMFVQNLPDRARGARQRQREGLHLGIFVEKKQDGFWSGNTAQMLWRRVRGC